ncbi:ubiquitin-conjugating enzyme [Diaporthe helianthi]|uniref:peptidylprolyl isomerase n=1 Tax=Diaporthe helianthi TaxID=158607 RepID=A0A2P5HGA2_DIAHE|nr:ubiquitin-conjugating enzyme [Diaporthe helianthi]
MDKRRYLVIIACPPNEVVSATPGRQPSLLVPFSSQAVISSFIDELWKRLARHDRAIPLSSKTHKVSLHLENEDGPAIDVEDLLSDVIHDTQKEKIFAIFSKKSTTITSENAELVSYTFASRTPQAALKSTVEKLPLEVVTTAGLQQALCSRFGQDLETRKKITYHGEARASDDSEIYTKIPVVSLCSKQRHVPIHARAELDGSDRIRPQVLDLHTSELPIHPACFDCSVHALGLGALAVDGIVDIFAVLRTSSAQLPLLHGKSAIFRDLAHWEPSVAQSDRGMAMFLSSLRVFASILQDMQSDDGARDRAYYAFDELTQFPPALRCLHLLVSGQTPTVFDCAALSQSMFEVLQGYMVMDAVTSDSARLFEGSRLLFGLILEVVKSLPINSIGESPSENQATQALCYTSAFHTHDVCDHKTHEPVLHAVQTPNGLIETNLFNQLQHGGILAETHLQSFLSPIEADPKLTRLALQSGGTCAGVLVFSLGNLRDSYRARLGVSIQSLGLDQTQDLLSLAEMCSRHGLAVYGPSQLVSAVAPCLTFDRNAHLAVYTGEQPCAMPGRSSTIFRPRHGEETIDPSVMEQLIAPIIKTYEQDGSAVFDSFGDAQVRRLQDPDEIIVFCVDSSCSMCGPTDFSEVNEESAGPDHRPDSPVEEESGHALSFEESKERLVAYESFGDIVAIVATTSVHRKDWMAKKVLALLASLLCSEIKAKALQMGQMPIFGLIWRTQRSGKQLSNTVPDLMSYSSTPPPATLMRRFHFHIQPMPHTCGPQDAIQARAMVWFSKHHLDLDVQRLKAFYAGLKLHEEALAQFLRFQASCLSPKAASDWVWSFGDPVPPAPGSEIIPSLAYDITEVPSHLRCPISHSLMEDAVEASDGQTYSRSAIQRWFAIRKTSPLHGAPLDDLSLRVRPDIRREVGFWISGAAATSTTDVITVTFDSRYGSFIRTIPCSTSSKDLYSLAYRGLKAKFEAFQLSFHGIDKLLPITRDTVSSLGLKDSDHIVVRIPEDSDPLRIGPHGSSWTAQGETPEMCLVKVYELNEEELFAFWVPSDTTNSFASLIWKYWRYQSFGRSLAAPERRIVMTDVRDAGDGWFHRNIPEMTERLASYLTLRHCTGKLEPETVFGGKTDTPGSQCSHKVFKVIIGREHKEDRTHHLSRLDVLRQMFEALINRMLAYNYKNHVGLVKFSSEAQVVMPISHVLENFRRATNELKGGGDTALWDALALAADQIEQYASRYPAARKRIIVISDGSDNKSTTNTCQGISWNLLQKGIAIDSVSLGKEDNADLRTLSYLCGSYRFHPTSLKNGLAICEMEPFLSLSQRPPVTLPFQNVARSLSLQTSQFSSSRRFAHETLVTDDTVPPIREHPSMKDDFVQLNAFVSRRNAMGTASHPRAASVLGRPTLRVPRLMNEIRSIAARGGHIKYDVYISTTDMSFWKIVVEGPDGSPYCNGVFLLYLHADEGYPRLAPKARFVTKIQHPNVNIHGRICHSIFDRDWTSDTSMGAVLDTIYGLLYQPESSDPVNTATTLGFFHDPGEFAEEAREHVRRHASKTREEWKAEILGE